MTERDENQKILTVLSWNVNGFNRKRSEVLHQLGLLKADVVFLQETHVGPDKTYSTGSIKIVSLDCDYDMAVFTVFKGKSRGVAVLFRNNLDCGGFKVDCDDKGRYIIISCQIWGHDFVFINVYNSSDEKIKFTEFTSLSTEIPPSAYLVIGGDFNTVMNSDLDRTSNLRNRNHRKSFDALERFLATFNLVDVWRCVYPEVQSFTFFDGKGQSRLDYFFIQSHNLEKITACNIYERQKYLDKDDYISDHAPLSIQIQTSGPKWQLDDFLLKDKACIERLSCIIKTISGLNTKRRKGDLWPGVKIRLLCEATALQSEKPRCLKRMQTFELPQEMEHEGSETHFEDQPNLSDTHLQNFLDHLHRTERCEDIKSTLSTVLTEPVSKKEILVAILSLPEHKCLTSGGLTVLFYKHYASKITDLLQAFFNQILDVKPIKNNVLERTYDHTYSHNIQYHCNQFTVIDVDYTILASVLAERLNSVIAYVLNPGESSVQDSINALQILPADPIPVLMVSLGIDAGALKWSYLFYSLKFGNLPDRFTSVLNLLLTEGDANMQRTRSNSLHSPLHGLKEECPLTPLLISICLLPLIHSINCEKRLLGAQLQVEIPKSLIDKDKAIIFLPDTREALDSFEKMLQDFTETSGFIIDRSITGSSTFNSGKYSCLRD